jgi:hypothetical protein
VALPQARNSHVNRRKSEKRKDLSPLLYITVYLEL